MKLKTLLLAIVGSMALLVSSPAWSDEVVNINSATAVQLQSVKGIGPKLAGAIVDYRNAHGAFRSVDALTEVKGIGKKKLERIRDHLTTKKSAKAEKKENKMNTSRNEREKATRDE